MILFRWGRTQITEVDGEDLNRGYQSIAEFLTRDIEVARYVHKHIGNGWWIDQRFSHTSDDTVLAQERALIKEWVDQANDPEEFEAPEDDDIRQCPSDIFRVLDTRTGRIHLPTLKGEFPE